MTFSPLNTATVLSQYGDNNRRALVAIFVVHCGEGSGMGTALNLATFFASDDNEDGTSPHACFDAESFIGMQEDERRAYACGPNGNGMTYQVEQPGRAEWSYGEWILYRGAHQFVNGGIYFADWATRYGIPLRRATNDDILYFYNGGTDLSRGGYVDHNQITESIGGTTHWDVGPNYPWDLFESGYTAPIPVPTPTPEDDEMTTEQADRLIAQLTGIVGQLDLTLRRLSNISAQIDQRTASERAAIATEIRTMTTTLSAKIDQIGK